MANSNNTYNDEDTSRFNDDCVEGDTVSEGDTSDEEDIEASKNNSSSRRNSSIKRKASRELPSGSADGSGRPGAKRRKLVYVALAIAAVVATSAVIGGVIYASTKKSASATPATTFEEEFASDNSIPKGDALGLLEDIMDHEYKNDHEGKNKQSEKETEDKNPPTRWPNLVGMTGNEAKAELELLEGEETYDIHILHENDRTTRDYRFDRIRIFTNDEGVVTKIPHIG